MGGKKSKAVTPAAPVVAKVMNINTILSTLSGAVYPRQRTVENFLLVWLDANIEVSNRDKCFVSLRGVINEVNFFSELSQCVQFLEGIDQEKVFVLISGSLGEQLVPIIHALPQIEGIYVFCLKKDLHEVWTKRWNKVKGIFTNIQLTSQALKQTTRQCNEDLIGLSFITLEDGMWKEKFDQLHPSFAYTQILKGILSDIIIDETSVKNLADYCRDFYHENTVALGIINEFESDYRSHSPIWWYTRPCFIYQMLNRALRTLEGEITLQMGFFIRDLHQQIQELHQQQIETYQNREEPAMAYRGQSLSKADTERLLKDEGGLISFDGFMFACTNRDVSLKYATEASCEASKTGVLFQITLNPSLTSVPFASIRDFSYNEMDDDILFSMHSVFRVNKISQIDSTKPLYQVDLQPIGDDNLQLQAFAQFLEKYVKDEKGWIRIPNYLFNMDEFDKAERFCMKLLEQTSDVDETIGCYCQLGCIKGAQGENDMMIEYAKKVNEIADQEPPPSDYCVAKNYENMSDLYSAIEQYSDALSYQQSALEVKEESLPSDHPDLATAYQKIAKAYLQAEDVQNALAYHQKALEIKEKILPPNHPDLAEIYKYMGMIYVLTDDDSKALESYHRALAIQEKADLMDYEEIVDTYQAIAPVYLKLGDYPTALPYFEKMVEINRKILPSEHLVIVAAYKVLALVHEKMENYSLGISVLEEALKIRKEDQSPDDPEIADLYKHFGSLCQKLEKHSDAISWYEKELEVLHKVSPDDHTKLTMTYHGLSVSYHGMKDLAKAVHFEEKSLEACKAMPDSDLCLQGIVHQSIGRLLQQKHEYAKALVHYEKSIELFETPGAGAHPNIVEAYNSVAAAYKSVGDYPKALAFYLKVLEMKKRIDPEDVKLGSTYHSIAFMYKNVKEYATAIEYYERAKEAYLIEFNGEYLFMKSLEANIKFAKKRLPK